MYLIFKEGNQTLISHSHFFISYKNVLCGDIKSCDLRAFYLPTILGTPTAEYDLELYDNLEMLRHKIATNSENYRIDKIAK